MSVGVILALIALLLVFVSVGLDIAASFVIKYGMTAKQAIKYLLTRKYP